MRLILAIQSALSWKSPPSSNSNDSAMTSWSGVLQLTTNTVTNCSTSQTTYSICAAQTGPQTAACLSRRPAAHTGYPAPLPNRAAHSHKNLLCTLVDFLAFCKPCLLSPLVASKLTKNCTAYCRYAVSDLIASKVFLAPASAFAENWGPQLFWTSGSCLRAAFRDLPL